MTEIKELSQVGAILNGASASFLTITATHWLFTIKTAYMSTDKSFLTWRNLYRGYSANLVCDQACQIGNFYGFHLYSKTIMQSKTLNDAERCVGGIFSGMLAAPVLTYCERIMILRQQGNLRDPVSGKILDASRTMQHLWAIEGKRSLVKAVIPATFRESINSLCFFGLSEILKKETRKISSSEKIASPMAFFTAGAFSGAVTTTFDLVKTRMLGSVGGNMTITEVVKGIVKNEGLFALITRGMPARALTIATLSSILGPISEFVRGHLAAHPALKIASHPTVKNNYDYD